VTIKGTRQTNVGMPKNLDDRFAAGVLSRLGLGNLLRQTFVVCRVRELNIECERGTSARQRAAHSHRLVTASTVIQTCSFIDHTPNEPPTPCQSAVSTDTLERQIPG
jgi:hypothetical protein